MIQRVQADLVNGCKTKELGELSPAFIWLIIVPVCLAFSPVILLALLVSYPTHWWDRSLARLEKEFAREVKRREELDKLDFN